MAPAEPTETRARRLLEQMLGPGATFRDGQLKAILTTVDERGRTLLVQRTGWGKSVVYFIASKILREVGFGPTLLVSPLLSLMRNQIAAAERAGVRAARMDSENADRWAEVEAQLALDQVDVLLISPERLANERFQRQTLRAIRRGIGLLVVDEAHCISDWGHDFRPDYRRIVRIVQALPHNVPVLATTATANDHVVEDIRRQLGDSLRVIRGPLTRESLTLQTIRLADQAERYAWLGEYLPRLPGSGIIYCLTTGDCDRLAVWLQLNGINVAAYHSRLDPEIDRAALEQRLLNNEVKALVATIALGMGFDKPDLGFVVHFQRPGSLVAYYQQIGRAGRALAEAYAILLCGREDDEIQEFFIKSAFPDALELQQVLTAIESVDTISPNELQPLVNMRKNRLEQSLKLLEVDGAIAKDGSRYHRTANRWTADRERSERVTAIREEELRAIQHFVDSPTCLMERVAQSLDDEHARVCGRCSVCRGPLMPTTVNDQLVRDAIAFLQRSYRRIQPRRQWPRPEVAGRRGNIPANSQASVGYALSIWGDAGWASLVRKGKYDTGRFDDHLVQACVEMIQNHWRPAPPPRWVTAVPSRRRPGLVSDFARRLADSLGLPFVESLRKIRETEEQKTMENSAKQLSNIAEAFEPIAGSVPADPVLLVDDMVDSGWTFTECAYVLRSSGCGEVYPLALAVTSGSGDGS